MILDPDDIPEGLCDSKALTPDDRDRFFEAIMASALAVSVASASAIEIDAINIRQATLLAMRRAIAGLAIRPSHVLVDGNDPPSVHCPCHAVVKGDDLICSIAAASIVAKVTRDAMMARMHARYPAYGFAGHVGYATPQHRAAIGAHGPGAWVLAILASYVLAALFGAVPALLRGQRKTRVPMAPYLVAGHVLALLAVLGYLAS